MKRIFSTLLGVLVISSMTYASFSQKQFSILFSTDSFSLDLTATAALDDVVAFGSGKYFELTLDAHTDNVGTSRYNIELSKKRAFSVRDYLVSKGVDENRVHFSWYGETKPIDENATEEGKQANRRVTVILKVYDWKSAQDILDDVSENLQEFKVDPEEETVIETTGGIKIEIPSNAFVTAGGLPLAKQEITVLLTEALSKENWLMEGLSTVSPEGILESGGMFKIEAVQNGEQLALKEGNKINVQVPFQSPSEGMSLFYANTAENGSMSWQQSDETVNTRLNVTLPAMEVDRAGLDVLIAKYSRMHAGYIGMDSAFFALTPKPEFKLGKPRLPAKPVKEEMRIYVSGMKSLFKTKKHKKALLENAYQKRLKVYEKNMAYYERRLKYYNQQKENFEKTLEEFYSRQPEYDRLINQAISVMDSLKTAYEKNVAYDRIHQCLAALKYKLNAGKITDPDYVLSLMNTYAYNSYSIDEQYPKDILAIKDKLKELGFTQPKFSSGEVWYYGDNQFRKIWYDDKQLMSLLNDAQQKLFADRLAKGIGNSKELNGYYLTSLSNMGWINIDRFSKMNKALTASLSIKQEQNSRVFIIFDEINSVLEYRGEPMNVPQNTQMTVFSVSLKNNLPHYAVTKIITKQKNTEVELKYQEGLLKDINSAIKQAV